MRNNSFKELEETIQEEDLVEKDINDHGRYFNATSSNRESGVIDKATIVREINNLKIQDKSRQCGIDNRAFEKEKSGKNV